MNRLINTLLAILVATNLSAQLVDIAYPHVIPMTPNAAELAKYADTPISYYTGTPNISIPLYEIEVDGLKIPVSLNYHASGIRVDQEATWVGLGWSLEIGSRISRMIKGDDDFKNNEYDQNFPFQHFHLNQPAIQKGYYHAPDIGTTLDNHYELRGYPDCEAYWGSWEYDLINDPEPDIFYYNLPNMSGKFILDKSRGAVLIDKSHNLKIEIIGIGEGVAFRITDNEGNQYLYNKSETTRQYTGNSWLNKNLNTYNTVYDDNHLTYIGWLHIRFPDCSQDYEPFIQNPYPAETSWCLTKITTKHGREINFTYDSEIQYLPTQESCEKYNHNGQSWLYYNKSKIVNNAQRLSTIEGDFGRIEFNSSDRLDMKATNQRSKKLESLSIYNSTNALVKSYKFDYTYFNDDYSGNPQYEHVFKRLKLNSVTEYTLNGSSSPIPLNSGYTFDYYEGNFPAKNSKNVDYWGFQNGRNYGEHYYIGLRINGNLTFEGVKKDSNFDKAIIGTLKRINYPTGGSAEYKFESNTISTSYLESHTYEWLPPTSNNLLRADVFNYYISVDHELYSELPAQETLTFVIEQQTKLKINCELENTMGTMDNTYDYDSHGTHLGQLRRINPTQSTLHSYKCPFLWDGTQNGHLGQGNEAILPEREFTLEPGTYEFEAYQPPRDVLASWRLHFDRPLPALDPGTGTGSTWPHSAGGIRISEIKTDATVRKFNYSAGTMMRQPALYYGGRRLGIPDHIGSCLVQVSESQTPLSSFSRGNFVGYDWVEEYMEDELNNISKTRYTFLAEPETELFDDKFLDLLYLNYKNGLPQSIERYKIESETNPIMVEKEEFFYTSTYSSIIKAFRDIGQKRHDSDMTQYYYQVEWPLQTQHVITTTTDAGENLIEETNYSYNSRDLVETTSYYLSDATITKKVRYPFDFNDDVSLAMVDKNMIGIPIESITLKDSKVVEATIIQYEDISGLHLPKAILKTEINTTDVSEANYSSFYQPFLNYNKYDSKGNILDVSRTNGFHTFYVWGYNQEYPIAKIENFDSNEDMTPTIQSLINNAELVSENDDDHCPDNMNCNEKNLRVALNALRNALPPNALITTYTYDPLIGITSVTDVNNKTIYYEYDSFGRLKLIRDDLGHILKTYSYNYKQN